MNVLKGEIRSLFLFLLSFQAVNKTGITEKQNKNSILLVNLHTLPNLFFLGSRSCSNYVRQAPDGSYRRKVKMWLIYIRQIKGHPLKASTKTD